MAKKNEAKVKFSADTKEFNNGIEKANATLMEMRSEVKLNSATMKNSGKTVDNLKERQSLLKKEQEAYRQKIEAINGKLTVANKIYGENSKEVSRLKIQLNSTKSAEQGVLGEIERTNAQLKEQERESKNNDSALGKLTDTINEQEDKLAELKKEYENSIITSGKYSKESKDLRSEIARLCIELDSNEKKLKKVEDAAELSGKKVKESAEGYTMLKDTMAGIATDAIESAAHGIGTMAVSGEQNLDKLQAKIGASAEDMKKYHDVMYEVFEGAYGDSLDDVGNAVAEIRQQLGDLNQTEMKEAAENALTLSDIYDMDVKESTRAVNSLIKQYELTAKQSYNLIVQGAQNGLNQNDDLLDTINEYAVQFKKAGYEAEDMFNMLANGVKSGTWSVDKLGDAVKEMNIRFSDGTIAEGLMESRKALGYTKNDVVELQKEFNKGGDTAQIALKKVMDKLSNVKDDTLRYQIGVTMFGTMWEDLGEKTVRSLVNTRGEIKKTNSAISQVKATAYDNVGTTVETLKRTFQNLGAELAEDLQPQLNDLARFIKENSEEIIHTVKVVTPIIGTMLATDKIVTFGKNMSQITTWCKGATAGIKKMVAARAVNAAAIGTETTAATGLTSAIGAQTTAQVGLTAASAATVGIAGAAIGTFALLGISMYRDMHKTVQLTEETKKANEEYKRLNDSIKENADTVNSEFGLYDRYLTELDKIVDKNGKIKKGYEDRAKVITNEMRDSLGIEIDLNNLTREGYEKVRKEIQKVIVAKKAEAFISANKENYAEALEKQQEYYKKLRENSAELEEARKKKDKTQADFDYYLHNGDTESKNGAEKLRKLQNAATEAQDAFDSLEEENKSFLRNYEQSLNTVSNYEKLQEAAVSGSTKKINLALTEMNNGFKRSENATKESLEAQVEETKKNLEFLKQEYKNKTPGITKEAVTQAEKLASAAVKELKKHNKEFGEAGSENIGEYTRKIKNVNGVKLGKELMGKILTGFSKKTVFGGELNANSISVQLGLGIGQNAEGGIYDKGAFLTTFAEKSKESAIPINGTARAKGLWLKTGEMLGMLNGTYGAQQIVNNNIAAVVDNTETNSLLRQLVNKDMDILLNGKSIVDETSSYRYRTDNLRHDLKLRGVAVSN